MRPAPRAAHRPGTDPAAPAAGPAPRRALRGAGRFLTATLSLLAVVLVYLVVLFRGLPLP